MDSQIPNTSGSSTDNQTPDTDIFQAKSPDEMPDAKIVTEKEEYGEGKSSICEEKTYTDPNSGYGQNISGYGSAGQNFYGNPAPKQNENPYPGGYPNYNQRDSAYGNNQYQQPNYEGHPNGGFQQGYNGNPNGGYQSNYIGVPYTGYQQNYSSQSNSPYGGMDTTPMTMGDWLLTILACMIPCAGTILSLIWAFGKHGNINRRNFCRAQLIITAVVLALYVIVVLIWGVSLAGALSTY